MKPSSAVGRPRRQATIELRVNDTPVTATVEARTTLADFIRHTLGLTGTHVGCEHGVCGACTVRVDGSAVRACILYAAQVDGAHIETVEGLADGDILHPLQAAFMRHGALQCGFCTPGFLMTAVEFLQRVPAPSREQVKDALSGSLCRCTGYQPIIDAVLSAAAEMASDA